MSYKTQGFINEVDLNTGAFTIDPTSPYAFEMRTPTGVSEKNVLFVQGAVGVSSARAVVVPVRCRFQAKAPMGCVDTLINLRHAHDKLEIEVDDKTAGSHFFKTDFANGKSPATVASIKIIK